MRFFICLCLLLPNAALADKFTFHSSEGWFIKTPTCDPKDPEVSKKLQELVLWFLNRTPEVEIVGESITLAAWSGGEKYPPERIVRDGSRWIAWFRGTENAYSVMVSIDPGHSGKDKTKTPAYFGIISRKTDQPCAEKWLGSTRRSK